MELIDRLRKSARPDLHTGSFAPNAALLGEAADQIEYLEETLNRTRCQLILAKWELNGRTFSNLTYKLLRLYGYPPDKLTEFAHMHCKNRS